VSPSGYASYKQNVLFPSDVSPPAVEIISQPTSLWYFIHFRYQFLVIGRVTGRLRKLFSDKILLLISIIHQSGQRFPLTVRVGFASDLSDQRLSVGSERCFRCRCLYNGSIAKILLQSRTQESLELCLRAKRICRPSGNQFCVQCFLSCF